MFQFQTIITESKNLGFGYYCFTLLAPEVASAAKPGQFVQVKVAGIDSNDPLLARPISIYRIDQTAGTISLLFKAIGRGTKILAMKRTGDLLEIIGPIGNGFVIPSSVTQLALVAGGIGMPPLFCLSEYLIQIQVPLRISLFYGGQTQKDLLELDLWAKLGVTVYQATEDGSAGFKGLVTTVLMEQYHQTKYNWLVACGPTPMLKAIQKIALTNKIPGLLSLEAHMACGVGACLGCTCETNQGLSRVCVDGPVFPIEEVIFHA